MASSFINSGTFEGKPSYDFFKALLDSENSSRGAWKSIPAVKNDVLIPQLALANITKAGEYTAFSATGSVTLSRKSVGVCPNYVNLEITKKDIEATFAAERMEPGQLNGQVAPEVMTSFLQDYIREQMEVDIESNTWLGITQSGACTGGLVYQAWIDSSVVDVVGTSSTVSNVIAEVQKVIAATPAAVRESKDYAIYVSRAVEYNFRAAMGAITQPYFKSGEKPELALNGYRMIPTAGLTGFYMFATNQANLWNVNDLTSDEQRLIMIDQTEITGDPIVRIAAQYKYTPAYGVGAQVVLYASAAGLGV